MSTSSDIAKLINDIGKGGMNESAIKGRLATIEDQAKAQEAELAKKDLEIAQQEKQLTQLHLEIHKQEQAPQKEERLEELADKILQLLANPLPANTISPYAGTPSLEQMARRLGIKQVIVQYHADVLMEKGLIELSASVPSKGTMYWLTPKGTAYVVENKLE